MRGRTALFFPRQAATDEVNRSRREQRRIEVIDVTAEQVCFPAAAQAARLRRQRQPPGESQPPPGRLDYLLTSRPVQQMLAEEFLGSKRGYWKIENGLHQRLDGTAFDEDRSRVRTPNNALMLGMFRRWAVSIACEWIARQSNPRRATLSGFVDAMKQDGGRAAFRLITSRRPRPPP